VLPLVDPHGLRLALVESAAVRRFTPFDGSPVPAERQVRGLHGARLWERHAGPTVNFVTGHLGLELLGREAEWSRYGVAGGAGVIDIREAPEARRGSWGVGCVHHLAWRVDDEEHQLRLRRELEGAGRRPTPVIDRFWFKSVYFLEPGGVLFELATDGPGFGVDEDPRHLGETLVLPPWLEPQRRTITEALPPLTLPVGPTTGEGR
jgi:glyoxalase family protein